MSEKTYRHTRPIEYAFCDHRGDARLSYLLAAAQQISMEQCDLLGIGGGHLHSLGVAFLLAKLKLDIPKTPHGGEQVELFTQPHLPTRAQYRRCTDFTAADGGLLARMDARWVLVDIQSRRLLRRLPEGLAMPFLDAEELQDFRPAPPEVQTPAEEAVVRCSMLDINGHMNNAAYGDLIMNLLEPRLLADKRISSVEIYYHREALAGDKILLYLGGEGDSFYIRGMINEQCCFEACGKVETV